uniref:ABM domain-containing protein n=1 Tax=Moniliophthora roreri TaxID=221103 RepID=A0A0W0EXW0_MONRR
MPITEFATLTFNTPISTAPLPELLQRLSTNQSAWSGYPLLFFVDTSDPNIIYLVSGWESVAAHQKWIESNENQELLRLFGPYVEITGFSHLEVNFDEVPREQGFLTVSKGDVDTGDSDSEAVWSGSGADLEDEKRPIFRLMFYHDMLASAEGIIMMRRLSNL